MCGPCANCSLVLVTFDALRADRLGAYGYDKTTSPNLDRFADESMVFADAMSQCGTTIASFPSLHTSRWPYLDGLVSPADAWRLREEETTLAEVLHAAGFHTAAVLGHNYVLRQAGLAQGFVLWDQRWAIRETADKTRARAEDALRQLEPPFFLWIHFKQPHGPYFVPLEVFDRFYDGARGGPTVADQAHDEVLRHFSEREQTRPFVLGGRKVEITDTMLRQYRALYDASIYLADREFGDILALLEEKIGLDRAVIAVASDHGETLGEHNRLDHNTLHRGVLHTPLMVRLPCGRGVQRTDPAMNIDIAPTLLIAVGLPVPASMRGRNLMQKQSPERPQYAEYEHERVLKLGRYKIFHRVETGSTLLFDVVADPLEQYDLAREKADVVARLERVAAALADERRDQPLSDESATMERLRSLGYIE